MDKKSLSKYVGNKIRDFRKARSMTQDDLAVKLNTTKQSVGRYENGQRDPSQDLLFKLASIFNVGVDDFFPPVDEERATVELKLYGSVAAGALAEVDGVTDHSVQFITFPAALLGRYAFDKDLFAMKVNGESMNKVIPNGSYIVAKRLPQLDYKDGHIVIFNHDNGCSLKRYLPHDISGLILFAAETTDNRIKDIVIDRNDDHETSICGKVIWYGVTLS